MGRQNKVYIIAEGGVNHNGSLKLAKRLVDAARKAGADAVKFQTFKAERLAVKNSPKAGYQKDRSPGRTQYEMLKKLELHEADFRKLSAYCKDKGIDFLSSPFDLGSVEFLQRLNLKVFKIPSGEITNYPYLRKIGSLKKKILLSTGMCTMPEIRWALGILTRAGTRKENITVLQCNTQYPTPYKDVNLRAMLAMRDKLKMRIGYSDHTPGIDIAVAAAALGAGVIEKHFTLDKSMPGPDHKASLDPAEFAAMVTAVRHVEAAMGFPFKYPTRSESANIKVARKSIFASKEIKKGERFTPENLTTMRPQSGISAARWPQVIGKRAGHDYKSGERILG